MCNLRDICLLQRQLTSSAFLHCYHHGATAFLCYTQLIGHTPVSWVPITLNLTVHVVMYWYYFQAARGIRIWWKEWITRLQIAQFVIDLGKNLQLRPLISEHCLCGITSGFVYYATYNYAASVYFPSFPHVGKCGGEEFAAFTGCATLSSYLVLFISFYAATYKKASKKEKRSTRAMSTSIPNKAVRGLETKQIPTMSETSETAVEALHAAEELMKAAGTTLAHDLHLTSSGRKN